MWATGFIVARLIAPYAPPMWFLAIRFSLAGLVILATALVIQPPWPSRLQGMHGAIAGALMHGGYLVPAYWAIAHGMPAGVSALIMSIQPVVTALLAIWMAGERIRVLHWLGLVVGMAGVLLVVWPKLQLAGSAGITGATVAATLAGALSISLGSVYQKRFATGNHLVSGGVWQYAGAAAVATTGALLTERFHFEITGVSLFALGWSVLVLSFGAISLYMFLIRHGEVSKVSSLMFLVPAVAAVMAYLLFGETLTAIQALGMAICAGAVALVSRRTV